MGDQLSFEGTLFEKERQLLFLTGAISNILQRLHYERTKITSTLDNAKSKRHKRALAYARTSATNSLEWLSIIQLHLANELAEIAGMSKREEDWYSRQLESDLSVPDAITTPYAIYQSYIGVYKAINKIFADNKRLISGEPPCDRLIKEFHIDMQIIGESLEEVL